MAVFSYGCGHEGELLREGDLSGENAPRRGSLVGEGHDDGDGSPHERLGIAEGDASRRACERCDQRPRRKDKQPHQG